MRLDDRGRARGDPVAGSFVTPIPGDRSDVSVRPDATDPVVEPVRDQEAPARQGGDAARAGQRRSNRSAAIAAEAGPSIAGDGRYVSVRPHPPYTVIEG